MPVPLLWDGATEGNDETSLRGICVSASDEVFLLVASYLLREAKKFPAADETFSGTDRHLYNVDNSLQSALANIGHQLLSLTNPCEGGEDPEPMIQLRQNPGNLCQLQQSLDSGSTWTLAYDYSLCQSPDSPDTLVSATTNNFNNLVQYYYDQYTSNYTSSVGDLYPDLVYGDNTTNDDYRDLALCYAVKDFVDKMCDGLLKLYDENAAIASNIKIAAAVAAGIAALIGLATGGTVSAPLAALASQATLWAAGIGLGIALGDQIYSTIINNNREIFEDLDARKLVKCAMLNILRGADVDQADFATSLDGLTFTGNSEAIAEYIKIMLAEPSTYAVWLPLLQQSYLSAKADILLPCDCAEYTLYNVGILTVSAGVVSEHGFDDGDIVSIPAYQNGSSDHWNVCLKLPAGNWNVEVISIDPDQSPPPVGTVNTAESNIAWHDQITGTFHNQVWTDNIDPATFDKDVTNNVFAPWGASQDWAVFIGGDTPFTIEVRLTLL